jgi:hypothetical protein
MVRVRFCSVVGDGDSKQLWLDVWDEDEGVFSSKGDGDFLGRIQIPLATLPAPTKSGWWELERRSAKSTVSGKIELAVFTYPHREHALTDDDISAASQTYRQLDELFVLADKGQVTDAHEALLAQFISQHDIPFITVAVSRFVSLVRVNMRDRMPASKIADAAERLTKVESELASLPDAQRQELLLAMAAVHKQFERMLWSFPEYFPFEDPDAANALYDYCDIVNLLVGIPLYRDTLDMHYAKPLDVFVREALTVCHRRHMPSYTRSTDRSQSAHCNATLCRLQKHAGRVHKRAVARAERDGKTPLEECVILTSLLLGALQPAHSHANPALRYCSSLLFAVVNHREAFC